MNEPDFLTHAVRYLRRAGASVQLLLKQKDKKKKCSPGEGAHHTIREAITMGAACFRSIHLFMIMTLWTVAAAGAVTVPAAIFLLR